jgi:hypothetical protein
LWAGKGVLDTPIRRSRVIGAVLLIILAGLALNTVSPAAAATYVPGVKTGDYLKYDVSAMGASVELRIDVTGISGTLVYCTVTIMGSSASGSIDIGDPSLPLGRFVLAKDLSPGDPITPGNTVSFLSSSDRTYAGTSRTVNYATFVNATHTLRCYYDRETGVLCEMQMVIPSGTGSITLKETNLWLNVVLVVVIVAVVSVIAIVVVAVIIVIRKRRGKAAAVDPVTASSPIRLLN